MKLGQNTSTSKCHAYICVFFKLCHIWAPNKHIFISRFDEYSHPAVCDTEIAAGLLGLLYLSAMAGLRPLQPVQIPGGTVP